MTQPDLENLMRLAKLIGGKFIIVEDGKPAAVLMAYQEFENLAAGEYEIQLLNKVERINAEITDAQLRDLREEVIAPIPGSLEDEADEWEESTEPIRIEPLAPLENL